METDSAAKNIKLNIWDDLQFPAKMWLLLNTSNTIMEWSRNGRSVLINLVRLDQYLESECSIFKAKSRTRFLRLMELYGFHKQRCTQVPNSNSITLCEYEHELFKKNSPDLLSKLKIQPNNQYKRLQSLSTIPKQIQQKQHSTMPSIDKARLNLRIILQMESEKKILNRKIQESGDNSMIELSSDVFVNPYMSVSSFPIRTDYAGYYGEHSPDKIKQFFGEYLPRYAEEDEGNDNQDNDTNLSQIPESSCPVQCSTNVEDFSMEEFLKFD